MKVLECNVEFWSHVDDVLSSLESAILTHRPDLVGLCEVVYCPPPETLHQPCSHLPPVKLINRTITYGGRSAVFAVPAQTSTQWLAREAAAYLDPDHSAAHTLDGDILVRVEAPVPKELTVDPFFRYSAPLSRLMARVGAKWLAFSGSESPCFGNALIGFSEVTMPTFSSILPLPPLPPHKLCLDTLCTGPSCVRTPRMYLRCGLEVTFETVSVLLVHLDHVSEDSRLHQWGFVEDWAKRRGQGACMVFGDLNALAEEPSPEMVAARKQAGVEVGRTDLIRRAVAGGWADLAQGVGPTHRHGGRIDHVLGRELAVFNAFTIPIGGTDHNAVFVEIGLLE